MSRADEQIESIFGGVARANHSYVAHVWQLRMNDALAPNRGSGLAKRGADCRAGAAALDRNHRDLFRNIRDAKVSSKREASQQLQDLCVRYRFGVYQVVFAPIQDPDGGQ